MGFDDDYKIVCQRTHKAYKQFGNLCGCAGDR